MIAVWAPFDAVSLGLQLAFSRRFIVEGGQGDDFKPTPRWARNPWIPDRVDDKTDDNSGYDTHYQSYSRVDQAFCIALQIERWPHKANERDEPKHAENNRPVFGPTHACIISNDRTLHTRLFERKRRFFRARGWG